MRAARHRWSAERVAVSVCDVTNGSSFYVHALSDREKLASLEERMRAWAAKVGVKAGAPVDVKRGPLLAAPRVGSTAL